MKRPTFNSCFSSLISQYLDYKCDNGFKEESYYLGLKKFDRFLVLIRKTSETFTKEDGELWRVKSDEESSFAYYRRITISHGFIFFLNSLNKDVYLFRKVPYPNSNFIPHIYTEDEIERYFKAVDTYPFKEWKDRLQMPIICRILYSSGTRIGETLQIRKKDVDLEKGIIKLIHTKNKKHRYIVLSDSMKDLFRLFADKCFYQLNDNDLIFTTRNGTKIEECKFHKKHTDILREAKIPFSGGKEGPRVHDWRHTFVVYSLLKMQEEGRDMQNSIYYLIKYLGHKSITQTERYIHLAERINTSVKEGFASLVDCLFKDEGLANEE